MQGKHSVTHNEVSTGRELPAFAGVHSGREEKGQRRSYMRDGPLREPSPIRQGISGSAVKDKNRNPEGNPRFFPGRFSSCAGTGQK